MINFNRFFYNHRFTISEIKQFQDLKSKNGRCLLWGHIGYLSSHILHYVSVLLLFCDEQVYNIELLARLKY